MTTITIPKKEYTNLLRIKRAGIIKAISITDKQKQIISQSFTAIKNGDYITLDGLKNYLGSAYPKTNR